MKLKEKIKVIDVFTEKYFVVSHNPILNLIKRQLGYPVTKAEMKIQLIKEELK